MPLSETLPASWSRPYRQERHVYTDACQAGSHFGHGQRLVDFGVEALHQRPRHAGRPISGVPNAHDEAGQSFG